LVQCLRFLVEVAPGKAEAVQSSLKALGVTPLKKVANFISIEIPPEMAGKVEALPHVVRVIEEKTYGIRAPIPVELKLAKFIKMGGPLNPFATIWAMGFTKTRWATSESRKILEANVADKMNITGEGVNVAVVDSGFDFLGCPQYPSLPAYMDSTLEGDPAPLDQNGHGTHVLTTIAGSSFPTPWGTLEGVAKNVTIGAVKALGYGIGTARTVDVIEAIMTAYANGAKIISMSLGSDIKPGENHDTANCPLCSTLNMLAEKGTVCVVAAGNSGKGFASCPGVAENVITVGALDKDLTIADFSSREHADYAVRRKPTVVAPGVDIGASTTGLIAAMEITDIMPKTAYISGTCLVGDTVVYTPNGPIPIKEFKVEEPVYSYGKRGIVRDKCLDFISQGVQRVYELTTADGRQIICTANHRFLTRGGEFNKKTFRWVPLNELNKGQRILAIHRIPQKSIQAIDDLITIDVANFLGRFLGDGWIQHSKRTNRICVPTSDEDFMEQFEALFGKKITPTDYGWAYADSKRLALALGLLGFYQKHPKARIPRWVYHLHREKIEAFVEGLLQADGWNSKQDRGRRIELSSENLVYDLKYLCDWIGWKAGRVRYRERILKAPNSKEVKLHKSWALYMNPNYEPKRRSARSGLKLVRVKDIREVGKEAVYDITTRTHNFIAEGIIVHNSMATPHVSGLMALWAEYLHGKGVEFNSRVVMEIVEKHGRSWDATYGRGIPLFSWVLDYV